MRIRVALAFISLLSLLALTAPAHAAFPGKNGKIAFATETGPVDVFSMNPDGTAQTNLTNNAAIDWQPTWSPDGKKRSLSPLIAM